MMTPFSFTGGQIPEGLLDFSYLLDAPAGKHGFLQSKNGHFYFEDGTQIKFFGVNLVFGCAMPSHETAELIAERLAGNGINMTRMHHVDSQSPVASLIDYSDGKSQTIHEENIERFDYLVYKLKEKGIYIHIDTHTLRKFTKDDGLDFDDDVPNGVKTVTYYNKRIIGLHRDYMQKYLCHKNQYTGLRYIDDPCIAVVQMVNENSIFWFNHHEMPPSYEKELNGLWNKWLLKKYGSRAGLDNAWMSPTDGKKALFADEDPAESTVKGPLRGIWGEKVVAHDAPYDTYESPARNADSILFYTEIAVDYYGDTSKFLRGIGVKCVINLTNLPANIAELYCIAQGEVVENNGYWNHPTGGFRVPVGFHDGEMVKLDPRKNHNMAFSQNLIAKFASSKVTGKPFMVTEWNVSYPTTFRSDVMLTLASYGAYQDWDGLLLFSYAHQSSENFASKSQIEGFFDSYNDPAMWGMAGIASAVFQGKFIMPPKTKVEIAYADSDRIAASWLNGVYYNSLAFMTGVSAGFSENGESDNCKANLVLENKTHIKNFKKDDTEFTVQIDGLLKEKGLLDKNYGYSDGCFINDSGEIKYDFKNGIFAIDTNKLKSICGYIKGEKSFGNFKTEIENEKASVTIISRDGENLCDSKKILLSVIGNCSNSDMVWEGKTLVQPGGQTVIEKIAGKVYIKSNNKSCNAYALDANGKRAETLETGKTENGFRVNITSETVTIYYELELG